MSAALPVQMLDDEQPMARDALEIATDALDEIALAGMSGSGNESEEGMREWHARRAWEFISIAARAKTAIREALAAPAAPVPEPTERVAVSVAAHINQELLAALQAVVEFDTYETEYAGSMVTLCPDCGVQDGGEHSASCAFSKAVKLIELALATPPQQATPAESMLTPHTCAGFDAAFRSEHQRPPTAQEVWGAAITSWRDLNTPAASTIAAAQPDDGWKEAAIAWEVCASIHRTWAKKDALFKTRQADFMRHADAARAALATQAAPVDTKPAESAQTSKSLNALAADLLRPFLRPGQKVIWREAFRWHDDDGVLSNHYDGMEIEGLAEDFGYEWSYCFNFKHAAIVGPKPAEAK